MISYFWFAKLLAWILFDYLIKLLCINKIVVHSSPQFEAPIDKYFTLRNSFNKNSPFDEIYYYAASLKKS